ncbi:hypothetical protein RhiXN_06247 [Rhizoctonia solani]|uniref:Transmembrane protein n=1 Tax=Rhizoctonia solani TaxID=456999 RepID=A0A8H8NYK7_9AGAM|nr:uncharacterized protein RhiXN_06247 [Rhizoctonia solani]QRW21258.1 hypothetical protein RhiXN_06247 [Rhizoctonia solani]
MSRRFVAPSVESRGSTSSIQTISSPVPGLKPDYLPPPSHPALARQRVPSPGPETYGALNRHLPPPPPPLHPLRAQSPAPPVPSRTTSKTVHSTDPGASTSISVPHASADPPTQLQINTIYSQAPIIAQPEPTLGDASTPVLVITPVSETLPPYSSEPNLASQSVPAPAELQPNTAIEVPSDGHNILGLQNHGHLSTSNISRIAPPLHPSRQPSPSPLIEAPGLRHRAHSSTNIGSARTLDSNAPSRPSLFENSRRGSGASIITLKDADLTKMTSQMYDAEEVERYLRLFASRVNEVAIDPQHSGAATHIHEEDGEWVSTSNPTWSWARNVDPLPPHLANPQNPFQFIAAIVYPYVIQPLPKACETKRKFRLNRAAGTAQRLYLAMYPAYVPVIVYLCHLSTWRDPRKSAFWCAVFWAAWAGGFLSQIIVGRLLYLLWTGGNVTREEIRRRRIAAREAEKLGKAIEGGIPGVGITGELGVWEVTKLVTGLGKKKSKTAKAVTLELQKDRIGQPNGESNLEDQSEDMEDWKLMLVDLADEVADLHERIKNIFLRRRPELTRFYIFLFALLFIGTFIVQDTSKIVTMVMGFWFWSTTDLTDTSTLVMSPSTTSLVEGTSSDDEADIGLVVPQTSAPQEDMLRKGAVKAWNWWGKAKKRIDQSRGVESKTTHAHALSGQSFPAQHRSHPGMLMISPSLLTFNSLFTSSSSGSQSQIQSQSQTSQDTRTVKVNIDNLRGVKKVSPSGLSVRYAQGSEILEEKFLFIVGRDEAFAMLVGWGGGRWKHV